MSRDEVVLAESTAVAMGGLGPQYFDSVLRYDLAQISNFSATVTVIGQDTGAPVCNVTIVVQPTGETITGFSDSRPCNGIFTVGPPGGDYVVVVEAAGYRTATVNVNHVQRGCHKDGGEATIRLQPN